MPLNSSRVLWILILVGACAAAGAQEVVPAAPRSHELPAPFGIGLTLYNQNQDYTLESINLGLPDLALLAPETLPVDNRTDSYTLKLDWWALPFLNLYAIGGWLDTTTTVGLGGLDLGLPFAINDLTIENDGWVYGGGLTLAGGWDQWFVTLSATYTKADLEVTDGSVKALVVAPKLGYAMDGGAIWIGAMYQDTEERHRGTYGIPYIGEIPFDVVMGEGSAWNGALGASVGLTKHFVLLLEGGFGDRQSAMVSLEYRR